MSNANDMDKLCTAYNLKGRGRIIEDAFSNVVVHDDNQNVLLQFRRPRYDEGEGRYGHIYFPFHFGLWGGKVEEGVSPTRQAENELYQEVPRLTSMCDQWYGEDFIRRRLQFFGVALMPIPIERGFPTPYRTHAREDPFEEYLPAGVDDLVDDGYTYWANHIFSLQVPDLFEVFEKYRKGIFGFPANEGDACIRNVLGLPHERLWMSEYKAIVEAVVLNWEADSVIFEPSFRSLCETVIIPSAHEVNGAISDNGHQESIHVDFGRRRRLDRPFTMRPPAEPPYEEEEGEEEV